MAIINDKKEFVRAVGVIVEADLGVETLLFPTMRLQTKELIEYDVATVEAESPEYNSFRNTAKVVSKDGKDRVVVAPVNFNESISKETIDADAELFGQNEYGDGEIDATMQSALTGVGKLRLRSLVGKKRVIYEALTTHKIVGGYMGKDGVEDIVFNVPAANTEVFDGVTLKYWSDATATPLDDIKRAYDAMKIKPTAVVMNNDTYSNFYSNSQVLTTDNSSNGTKKNYTENDMVDPNAKFFRAGRISYKGMHIDVYVESEQRKTTSGYTPFMPNGYVVYASPIGEMNYGGIPVAENGGVRRIAAEFDVEELITSNPPQHAIIFRTAPLPTLKNGEAYFTQKVEA